VNTDPQLDLVIYLKGFPSGTTTSPYENTVGQGPSWDMTKSSVLVAGSQLNN